LAAGLAFGLGLDESVAFAFVGTFGFGARVTAA
jgi:hypothetical protein